MQKKNSNWVLCSMMVSAALAAGAAHAEDAAAGKNTLDEVIVTAQRIETNLQRTPVAVTSVSAAELAQRGVTNILDLSAIVPNVSIGTRSGGGTAGGDVTIRGIGIDANPPASAAVGIYIDEVYYPASWGNLLGVFDVDRIEILRGPQGTLFGRNTVSGAILYNTKKPTLREFNGFVEGTAGNLARADGSGAINVPLGEIAAVRLSLGVQDRNGYVHDNLNNIDRGSEHNKFGRLQVLIEPNDRLTISLKGEATEQNSNGRATINTAFNYNTAFGGPFAATRALDAFISPNWYDNAGYNSPESFYSKFHVGQATVSYSLNDDLTLKSISAYSKSESRVLADQDATPLSIISVSRGTVQDKLFTQEFQLIGTSLDGALRWTGGLYYYDESNNTVGSVSSIFGGPPADPFGDNTILTKSWAGYGQATFDLTSRLALVGGLRYTNEKISAKDAGIPGFPLSDELQYNDTSPLLGLNYQVTDNAMLYVKGSRAFRAGNFAPTFVQLNPFGPEKATTYEAGARTQWAGSRVRLNPTVFYTTWKDIQFNSVVQTPAFPAPLPIIANAGDAKIYGFELEGQFALTEHFLITASGSYLHTEYTQIDPSLAGKLSLDSPLKRSPEFQYFLGARYSGTVGKLGDLVSSLGYAWQAKQRSATTDVDNVEIAAYGLLNARVEWHLPGDRFWVSLFGTNLTNREYAVGGINYGAGGTIPVANVDVGRPREYGVTLRANF